MKREYTNIVRYVMDELVPPVIRDSKAFMWPFYLAAYGKNAQKMMNFKTDAYHLSVDEYTKFYGDLESSISRNRNTDLTLRTLNWIVDNVSDSDESILDVGCGNGYLLSELHGRFSTASFAACDAAAERSDLDFARYSQGLLPSLPFKEREFDVVCCSHVLEHVPRVEQAAKELVRVTRRKLLIVVPKQRYYYYTLDEHLNFFTKVDPLIALFDRSRCYAHSMGGDWVLLVDTTEP
jgi:ubiquinone/menaquinone biosynthesis C-methylase UbiE